MSNTVEAVPAESDLIRFQVRVGIKLVECLVQNEALEAASGLSSPSTSLLRRRSFDRFRTLLNAAAKQKFSALPAGSAGRIVLTTADLRGVPPEPGMPSFGSVVRMTSRPATAEPGTEGATPAAPPIL